MVVLSACKPEEESAGLGAKPTSPAASLSFLHRHEPALESMADSAVKKLFAQGLRSLRHGDFSSAEGMFAEAERRHRQRGGDADELIDGCLYYTGRCRDGSFKFEEAKTYYIKVSKDSAYRPAAEQRMSALTEDSDGDGYMDAWEEAEGTNPSNPLSHP